MAGARGPSIAAYVSEEAHDGWHDFARVHGVTVSAMVEALGRELATYDEPGTRLPAWLRQLVADARTEASGRRRLRWES